MNKIDALDAIKNARENKYRQTTNRYKECPGIVKINHSPKFKLKSTDSFFTIGSCFARNIENVLGVNRIPLLSKMPSAKGELYKIGGEDRAGYQNVYTPGGVLEFSRLLMKEDQFHSIVEAKGKYYDLLTHGLKGLSKDESDSIRQGMLDTYQKLKETDVLIITLGYVESWYYKPSDSWVNQSPVEPALRAFASDFELRILDYDTVITILEEAISNFRNLNGNLKIVATVSPVPLGSTFTSEDVLVANSKSKNALHTAAQYLTNKYDFIDYFPSYEAVTLSDRKLAFKDDAVHVEPQVVRQVMSTFMKSYFE